MNLRNFTHEADYHVQMCVYVFGWRMVSHCDESVINYCCMAIILTAAFLFLKNSQMEKNETRKRNSMMGLKNSDSYDLNFDAESNIRVEWLKVIFGN